MRIAVAMSGGVDSSVAAAVLKAQGHEVLGLTMKLWVCSQANPERAAYEAELAKKTRGDVCCSPADVLDAKDVCATLGIPHYTLEMAEDFSKQVIEPFIDEYARGRTPSPCVRCNERVKSKGLVTKARELGCARLATGHYARIRRDEASGRFRLLRGVDEARDQSYFLFPLTQDELAYLDFPVGELPKSEVRRMAAELSLVVARKPDSQEICFVKDKDHRRFLREKAPAQFTPGPILHADGRELGAHDGLIGYTIGQRRGLGVAFSEPLYVVKLDLARNAVVLGPDEALWAPGLEARAVHWIAGAPPKGTLRCEAKVRHSPVTHACTVHPDGEAIRVHFDEPVRAITPGQAVVLYEGEEILGGGWIERALENANVGLTTGARSAKTRVP
ncbi:MAG: tRNA 2-thiouridine(34) synthase MnmA [Planctomycetota bacterium]|nr:tRNA 2-thiouridine(34) synthase MnmA [Planctomycetota bacterium]